MGCYTVISATVILVSLAVYYVLYNLHSSPEVPDIVVKYWGPGKERPDRRTIQPFKINIPEEELKMFELKLNITTAFVPPLEDVGFNYGVNSDYMKDFLNYWKNNYNWRKREAYLNTFPQYKTEIGGLNIHFLHVKPDSSNLKGRKVLPLLIIHGWPGSVREFYDLIPMLTTPRADADFVFEVVAPSLPGYGFSEGASKPGLGPGHIGAILNELMARLGFDKYYVQGGDWGAIIGYGISVLYPNRVMGFHSVMCISDTFSSRYRLLWASLFPSFYVDKGKEDFFWDHFIDYVTLEGGYFHIQASKPDTIGLALTDSPAGLAGYIIEKFSTWTKRSNRNLTDGGLESLNKDALIDNVMIYWFNRAITPSMRIYSEFYSSSYQSLQLERIPVNVPTGCAQFPNELFYYPSVVIEGSYTNIVSLNYMSDGGHFPALEQPKLLADDFWSFVKKVERIPLKKRIK